MRKPLQFCWSLLALLALGGCQSPSAPRPAAKVEPKDSVPVASTPPAEEPLPIIHTPAAPPGTPVMPPQSVPTGTEESRNAAKPIEERATKVESNPPGAIVVVDGVPVGRTPLYVPLDIAPTGFLRKAISIRVRFVAGDSSETTQTVEANLSPLDKAPACLKFEPSGVQRVLR